MTQIKFLQVFPFYQSYLNGFYSNNLNVIDLDYKKNQDALMSDCFGTADFWVENLNKLGNYEANAVVFNDKVLQLKWAKEHQIKYNENNWVLEILEAQINELKPEVVFWNDCMFPNVNYFEDFKKKFPFVKLLIGWDGVALNNLKIFKNFDIVLTCAQWIVDFYNSHRVKSYYVPFGFEEGILQKLNLANFKKTIYEISFCGSLNKGPHLNRYLTLLSLIKDGLPLKIFTDSVFETNIYNINFFKKLLKLQHFEILDDRLMMRNFKPPVYGLEMYNVLKNSKLSINIHIDKAKNEAANMRLFEITGVGSCMVTDWKENLSSLFIEDEEVVVFKTIEEAKDKISNLLRDDTLRKKIALAGQTRTLKDYKFINKVIWLDKTIQSHLYQ
jgi:hypothetical protein